MFEAFYSFSNTPFSRTIPTHKLYRGNDSDELIERLKYAAGRQLFAVLLGECGTGKTTTLRRFCDEIRDCRCICPIQSSLPEPFTRACLSSLDLKQNTVMHEKSCYTPL